MKEILKTDKKFVNILPFYHLTKDDYPVVKEEDLIYVDQTPAQSFNINEAGWIRNDVSAFEQAESENLAMDILSRFEELKQEDLYKDMTDDEMFEAVITRRATTDPVLYARALEVYTRVQYKKAKEEAEKQAEKEFSEREIKEANEEKDFENNSQSVEVSASAT